jgi:ADP-heptose:LPS heptosyltransferase
MLHIPLNRLALIMQHAKLVVTIDNGMSHLAASQSANTFLMYPQCLGTHYILPIGNPNLEYVQMNPVYVSPAQLLFGLKKAVERFKL